MSKSNQPPTGGADESVREQKPEQRVAVDPPPEKPPEPAPEGKGVEKAGAWARLAYYAARLWDLFDDHT